MMDAEHLCPSALLLSQDLFFTSKVTGAAGGMGYRIELADNTDQAAASIEKNKHSCVIVDLATHGLCLSALMQMLSEDVQIPVIAFGAHVKAARLQEAKEAGCTEVLSKGKFSAVLPELLQRYLGSKT